MRALPLVFACLIVLAAPAHAAGPDENYRLTCNRELGKGDRTSPLARPFIADVRFTGKERRVYDRKAEDHSTYEDLTISLEGRTMQGGRVFGSTYEASTTYDGTFEDNLRGSVEWAYSRGLNAFTLSKGGRIFVCKLG